MKDSVEVRLPASDRFLIILGTDKSGDRVPLALFGYILLNFLYSAVIKSVIDEPSKLCIAGPTYVVN